jgi:hypothetical protein
MGKGLLFAASLILAALAACSGDPSPGGSCQSNRDCLTGETCISGACLLGTTTGCRNDEQCPIGQFCDSDDQVCKTFTSSTTDGGVTMDAGTSTTTPADGGVGGDGGTGICSIDSDCGTAPVDICIAEQCVLGCGQQDGLTCTGGQICDMPTGHCISENPMCQMDTDCNPPTEICIANTCVFGCALDSSLCQTGEVCDTNTGRCVVVQTGCTMDSECNAPMTICESNQCIPGCAEAGGIQCGGQTPFCDSASGRCTNNNPNSCNLDADCMNANEICVNMTCTLRCDAQGGTACVAPAVCDSTSGRCVSGGLALGDTCAQDTQCTTGLCLALTIGTTTMNFCSIPCGATSQCPLDFTCGDVSGMGFCLGENLSTPPATWDTTSGGACSTTTNTCQSGWCNTGQNQCIEKCSRAADCASFGGNCWSYEQVDATTMVTTYDNLCYDPGSGGATGAACTQNANCRSGICSRYSNTCAAHCCSASDCPTAQVCEPYDLDAATVAKVCGNRAPATGTLGLGATCTAPGDCASEVCAALDPAVMGGPRKCSTLCCQESDCSALPAGGLCRAAAGPVAGSILGLCFPN